MGYAEDLVSVSITRATRTPTQAGFGTPLVAAYHTKNTDRVREYTDPADMVTDGFTPYEPAYLAVQSILAQNPSVSAVKVGRRALPFTQIVHITPAAPVSASAAEIYTTEVDGYTATFTTDATPTVAEVCTGLAAAINALGDVDAIIATGASAAAPQTLSGATLDGVVGDDAMPVPRFLSLVLSNHADWDATTAVLTAIDANGTSTTENLLIPNGGAVTLTTTRPYLRVVSLAIPAQSGAGGTFTFGTRALVTADGSSGTHVVCTSVAGELHSYAPQTGNLSLTDATANPGIATDLAAIQLEDADWYGLLLDSQGVAEITAAAIWTEANKKLFVWQSADAASLSSSATTDPFHVTKLAGYVRSGGIYYPELYTNWIAAAWMGEEFPKAEGSSTWMWKTLAGITVYELTPTQRAALEAKNGNHYIDAGGNSITGPGDSASGEWLDVIRDLDWLEARMRERVLAVFLANDKVPFTDQGISLVVAAVRAQLTEGVDKGVLAADPKFTLTVPLASAVTAANKRLRRLPDVTWIATLAGAIHSVVVTGTVSV